MRVFKTRVFKSKIEIANAAYFKILFKVLDLSLKKFLIGLEDSGGFNLWVIIIRLLLAIALDSTLSSLMLLGLLRMWTSVTGKPLKKHWINIHIMKLLCWLRCTIAEI